MRKVNKLTVAFFGLAGIAAVSQADVGVLDKYECHNHSETNKYHCHGDADLAKLGGFVIGADTRIQGWSTNSDELFLFAGIAVNAEYNYRWAAITGSYFYMPLLSGVDSKSVDFDDSVHQQGWEAGIKAGPGVGRLGSKVYGLAGWTFSELTDTGDSTNDSSLSGYYLGGGFGFNTQTLVFDVIAIYRDPTSAANYLEEQNGQPYDVLNFETRVSLGWRF